MTKFRFAARSTVAAACTALAMAAAPAFASHGAGSHDIANTQKLEVRNDGKGHVLYCAVQPQLTGSIMNATVCKTEAQWKAEGVNIPAITGSGSNVGA
jgi:hypothetical protein